ncbi:hypothetical protein JTE90_011317 [Oedothorax gibbosus]|uniref:Prolactin receptor n=1 Tax=Oedothorax gibbosus TaxID=931172 RepID=A0AAV6VNQ8_9ARAC|nr:hypothetical protein JTE90_011317 [Oedothorax gibbosus]
MPSSECEFPWLYSQTTKTQLEGIFRPKKTLSSQQRGISTVHLNNDSQPFKKAVGHQKGHRDNSIEGQTPQAKRKRWGSVVPYPKNQEKAPLCVLLSFYDPLRGTCKNL